MVGRIIHEAAAKHLTPAVLELGGKNPTIVHSSADSKSAARRIAYGRFVNSGQICTAPDQVERCTVSASSQPAKASPGSADPGFFPNVIAAL